ncbi:MAG: class I SAM-dependent methyltransferase [Gemmatimonadaceae bacterium]|nr:class I SAM-dependent methyltransferase [Gemmatimonadaceae bacterium]
MSNDASGSDFSPAIGTDSSALPFTARVARGLRRAVGMDRETRWNREYAEGGWEWLRNLDELAHHSVLAGYVAYLKPGGSVLDVGCGEGVFQEQLRGAEARYLGVDFEEPVKKAQHKVTATTRFAVADMNEFTTGERFDVIVFNESIYYLHDLMAGLQRYEQFLAPDGVMLISMHGKERNDALWAGIDARYTVLDAVTMQNARGIKWTTKALVPPGSSFTLRPQAP